MGGWGGKGREQMDHKRAQTSKCKDGVREEKKKGLAKGEPSSTT